MCELESIHIRYKQLRYEPRPNMHICFAGKRNPTSKLTLALAVKHWNRYQVNRVESVSGATGSALEKTRIDAMQYIKTRPNTRFKKNIGA